MKKTITLCVLVCSFLLIANNTYAQERIAVIQEPSVLLLDSDTGDIVDADFIDLEAINAGTPKAILQVGQEIWITDQIEDRIDQFDLDGTHLGAISGGLDNIKGLALVDDSEVWVTNDGTSNGAPGEALVRFDLDGNNLGFISTGADTSFDIIDHDGHVYLSYIDNDRIEKRDYDGNVVENIVEPGVVSFIQQIEIAETDIYAAVFSNGTNPNGLYQFALDDGSIIDSWSEGSLRGVKVLGNGEILYSSGSGVFRLDPATGTSTMISAGSAQYFGVINFGDCDTPDTPTGEADQSFSPGAMLDDIVVTPSNVTWFATEADAMSGSNPLQNDTELEDGETYYAVNIVAGCLSEPFAVTVHIVMGLNEFDQYNFSYHPNPTMGQLTLSYDKEISKISLTTISGKLVLQQSVGALKTTVDMSTFPAGIYFLNVYADGSMKTVKVVKK